MKSRRDRMLVTSHYAHLHLREVAPISINTLMPTYWTTRQMYFRIVSAAVVSSIRSSSSMHLATILTSICIQRINVIPHRCISGSLRRNGYRFYFFSIFRGCQQSALSTDCRLSLLRVEPSSTSWRISFRRCF